jgi:hypothetical protein
MTWPPEGSKPPSTPRPTPRPTPVSRPASPGESTGETRVKPQAKPAQPPQFGHDGIDPRRALLLLGLLVTAAVVPVLVLVASPVLWWIAAGVAVAGAAGAVLLRRSGRARAGARRLPGVARAGAALRRMPNGRFARTPLGRVMNRALGRPSAGSRPGGLRAGGPGGRPRGLGARLRASLPSWAGGTRHRAGGHLGSAGRPPAGSRVRAAFGRLMPGGRRRAAAAGARAGRLGGRPGGATPGSHPRSRAARAWSRITKPFRPTGRTGGRSSSKPSPASSPTGRRTTPGKKKPSTSSGKPSTDHPLSLAGVRKRAGKAGRLVGQGVGALFGRLRKRRKKTDPADDFDKDSTYEIGIEGEVIDGKHTDAELGRIAEQARRDAAKRAKKLAKQRAKQAKQPAPQWPNLDVDEVPLPPVQGPQQEWPDYDIDDYAPKSEQQPPERSLPAERDRDPPPSPAVSPPPHRETAGEEPRITSANTKHGGTMKSADSYVQMIDDSTPTTIAATCEEAAEQARRDATEKEEEAKNLRREADAFDSLTGAGNKTAAQKLYHEAANAEADAKKRVHWAGRLDGMARDATAKLAG